MKIEDNFAEFDPSMVNFIATQVSTSITFAALARDTREFDKRQQKLASAQEGYAVALYYLCQARKQHLQMSPHIMEGMKMLRSMLREMGGGLRDLVSGGKVLEWRPPLEATHGTQTQLHH